MIPFWFVPIIIYNRHVICCYQKSVFEQPVRWYLNSVGNHEATTWPIWSIDSMHIICSIWPESYHLFLSNAMLIILFNVFKLNSGFSNKIVVSQKCPTVIPVKADFNKIGGCHELGSRDQNAWSISNLSNFMEFKMIHSFISKPSLS